MELISATIADGVLTICLNRSDKKNALTRSMYQSLADHINRVSDNELVKVILLKGEGDCFTAGNDIGDFAGKTDGEGVAETAAFMAALVECKKPIVVKVHGMALGIGTTLLLHCDLVYCTPDAKFVLPFINLGLVPEYASSYLLPRLAGHRKAAEWLMLGEPILADEAEQFGLVNRVIDGDLDEHIASVCQKLVAKPAFALSHTKALLKNEEDAIRQQINEEMDIFLEAMDTEAAREAFDAFLDKRPVDSSKFK